MAFENPTIVDEFLLESQYQHAEDHVLDAWWASWLKINGEQGDLKLVNSHQNVIAGRDSGVVWVAALVWVCSFAGNDPALELVLPYWYAAEDDRSSCSADQHEIELDS